MVNNLCRRYLWTFPLFKPEWNYPSYDVVAKVRVVLLLLRFGNLSTLAAVQFYFLLELGACSISFFISVICGLSLPPAHVQIMAAVRDFCDWSPPTQNSDLAELYVCLKAAMTPANNATTSSDDQKLFLLVEAML